MSAAAPAATVAVDEMDLASLEGELVLGPEDYDSLAVGGESSVLEGVHV